MQKDSGRPACQVDPILQLTRARWPRDGLPLFGRHPEYGPRVLFAMAYGGNGITYSMLGAALLRAQIERRSHPLSKLFSFERLRTA